MYEPGRIMRCGGGNPGVATTWTLAIPGGNAIPATWLAADDMHVARRNHNLVVLPDGRVLDVGGNGYDDIDGLQAPVYAAEIFDPASGAWTPQPESAFGHERWYHSTAVFLPDGRVVSAGGNGNPTAQIFNPPYITDGAPRPIITSAPTYMQYGAQYIVGFNPNGGPQATRACLIRLAAVTHGFDQEQRRVPLTIGPSAPNQLTISAPAHGNIAPPGYYMPFILNEYATGQFAPCTMARYVQVGP